MNYDIPVLNLKDQVSDAEWQTRIELAAAYRLMVMHQWDDLIHTHISARIPGTEDVLINAFGLAFEEVTASNLVKIDIHGNIIQPNCPFEINPAGFTIHSAVHICSTRGSVLFALTQCRCHCCFEQPSRLKAL